jgi:hypothetical protein
MEPVRFSITDTTGLTSESIPGPTIQIHFNVILVYGYLKFVHKNVRTIRATRPHHRNFPTYLPQQLLRKVSHQITIMHWAKLVDQLASLGPQKVTCHFTFKICKYRNTKILVTTYSTLYTYVRHRFGSYVMWRRVIWQIERRWRQLVPQKRWHLPARLHRVTSHEVTTFWEPNRSFENTNPSENINQAITATQILTAPFTTLSVLRRVNNKLEVILKSAVVAQQSGSNPVSAPGDTRITENVKQNSRHSSASFYWISCLSLEVTLFTRQIILHLHSFSTHIIWTEKYQVSGSNQCTLSDRF